LPTVFTHAFVGASLAAAGPRGVPRPRLALALAALAMLPDVDVVAFALGIPYASPLGHRGFTHSVLFAAVAALAVAHWQFRVGALPSRTGWRLCALLFLAGASHGLLDAMTNGGLGVGFLTPFDAARFFLPWRPLQVSPIGVRDFLSGPARRIFEGELLYVWLPVALALALSSVRRR